MHKLTVRVTDKVYKSLSEGTQTMTLQVQRILAAHFGLASGEPGEKDRVFETCRGEMALPPRILGQLKKLADERRKIEAIKLIRGYCTETYGRSKDPIIGTTLFHSRFGLKACKEVADILWAEWGFPTRPF